MSSAHHELSTPSGLMPPPAVPGQPYNSPSAQLSSGQVPAVEGSDSTSSTDDVFMSTLKPHDKKVAYFNCSLKGHKPSQCIMTGADGYMARITCPPCNTDEHSWVKCKRRLVFTREQRDHVDFKFSVEQRAWRSPVKLGIEWDSICRGKGFNRSSSQASLPYRAEFAKDLFFGKPVLGRKVPN
ncbi:hypothetical protein DL769_010952 [Monosporascus sp. CRB-8-3]|nr:hypothetical protein DL769_010952 [Monosporascus sp. CRB-8-3]